MACSINGAGVADRLWCTAHVFQKFGEKLEYAICMDCCRGYTPFIKKPEAWYSCMGVVSSESFLEYFPLNQANALLSHLITLLTGIVRKLSFVQLGNLQQCLTFLKLLSDLRENTDTDRKKINMWPWVDGSTVTFPLIDFLQQ